MPGGGPRKRGGVHVAVRVAADDGGGAGRCASASRGSGHEVERLEVRGGGHATVFSAGSFSGEINFYTQYLFGAFYCV